MATELPKTMKQVIVEDAKVGPFIKEVPMPAPGPKQVLVKIFAVPLIPFDRIITSGLYPPPFVLGPQASGEVVLLGPEVDKSLLGKKVHIGSSLILLNMGKFIGMWQQYVVWDAEHLYVYDQKLSHAEACGLYGNPLTALGCYRHVGKGNHKAAIVFPGASGISKAIVNLIQKDMIPVISIVRTEENAKNLEKLGQKIVLWTQDPKFQEKLADLIKSLNPTIFIDAVVDDLSGKIFMGMPPGSTWLVFGFLGGQQELKFPLAPMVVTDKKIEGYFWSMEDFKKPKTEIKKEVDMVNEDLASGGKIFGVPVVKEYEIDEFKKALEEQPSYASKGRGIIWMNKK